MAKSSGGTRTSKSSDPKGLKNYTKINGLSQRIEEAKRYRSNSNHPEYGSAIEMAGAQVSLYMSKKYSLDDLSRAYGSTFESRYSDLAFGAYRDFLRQELGESTFQKMLKKVKVSEGSKKDRSRFQSIKI